MFGYASSSASTRSAAATRSPVWSRQTALLPTQRGAANLCPHPLNPHSHDQRTEASADHIGHYLDNPNFVHDHREIEPSLKHKRNRPTERKSLQPAASQNDQDHTDSVA